MEESAEDRAFRAEIMKNPEPGTPREEVVIDVQRPESDSGGLESQNDDPWAGLPAALRTKIEAQEAKLSNLDQALYRLKQAEQRVGSLQNELHTIKQVQTKAAETPSPEEVEKASQSAKKWESLKSEFPEWAEAIEGRFAAKGAGRDSANFDLASFQDAISQNMGAMKAEMLAQATKLTELSKLEIKHPDYEEIDQDPRFKAWVSTQQPDIISLAQSARAKDVSIVLDRYKKDQNIKKSVPADDILAERQNRLQASQSVQGRHSIPPKSEADMTDEEYKRHVFSQFSPRKGT
jgi:hypothetical protein